MNLIKNTSDLQKSIIGQILALLIGFLVFSLFFDLSILDPSNINWVLEQKGDILQHQLGSMCFRRDVWYFPITLTKELNFPEGVSIVYTDSNILFSLLAKIFRGVFKPEYQFWGLWYLLCIVLQALFSYKILHNITGDVLYALLGASIFCLLPTFFHRLEMGHSNLLAHWLILAVISNLLDKKATNSVKDIRNWFILVLCASIHGYLMIMCLIIIALHLLFRLISIIKEKERISVFILINAAGLIAFILSLWILGYFYNQPENQGLIGFGKFSMNINSLINPCYDGISRVLPELNYNQGQVEGNQYLGIGILILHAFFMFFYIKNEVLYTKLWFKIFCGLLFLGALILYFLYEKFKIYQIFYFISFFMFFVLIFRYGFSLKNIFGAFIIAAIVTLFIALSNYIYIGETRILKIEVSTDTFLVKFFQMVRSSGRFYWVTGSIVLTLLFKYFYSNIQSRARLISFLGFVLAAQIADLSAYHFSKDTKNSSTPILVNADVPRLLNHTNQVSFINYFDITLCRDLLMMDKKINRFYMAHGAGKDSFYRLFNELENFKHSKFNENSAYLVNDFSNLPYNQLSEVIKLDSFNYLFANNLSLENTNNSTKIKVLNHQLTIAELKEKYTSNDLIILINQGSDRAYFKPLKSSSIEDFPLVSKEGEAYMAVFKNQKLQKRAEMSKESFQISFLNHTVSAKKILHLDVSDMYLTLDGLNILKPKKGISYVSIDKNGVIHTGYINFSEQ